MVKNKKKTIKALVHHSEIGLKGGNFSFFERKLLENIKKSSVVEKINLIDIERKQKRIFCEFESLDYKKIEDSLRGVFGIKYFSFVEEIELNQNKLEERIRSLLIQFNSEGIKKIAFKTKRANKNYGLTSLEVNTNLGQIAYEEGLKVDYKNPEKTIFIEIIEEIYIYFKKIEGPGGLPVGTSGKVICLLSGGIDSIVAAWLMMKRGCEVDFLHFHAFRSNEEALDGKIRRVIKLLNKYQYESNLYLVPYHIYFLNTQDRIDERYDIILFKNYMLRFAEKLAFNKNKDNFNKKVMGIVTGDNLAQVASQTLENLKVTSWEVKNQIFRPLLTYDKQEIIDLLKKIDGYSMGIESYKDCCSILSRKVSVKTELEVFKQEFSKIDFNKILEDSLEEVIETKL